MDYSFIIRRATENDASSIKEVMSESFKKYMLDTGMHGSMEALDESIEDITADIRDKFVYIAFVDEHPVGSIRISLNPNKTAYISRFGVRSGYRSIGIGRSFMNLSDKLLKSQGIQRVMLHTASKYTELIRFYYGCGFYIESTSTDRGYIRARLIKDYTN